MFIVVIGENKITNKTKIKEYLSPFRSVIKSSTFFSDCDVDKDPNRTKP